jgi:hypothetical protein
VLAWAAASMAVLVVAGIFVDSSFDRESAVGLCNVPVRSVAPGPDARHSAVVFEVYCGPLPPDNTHISVVPANQAFSWKRDSSFFILGGTGGLKVQWTGTTSLEVSVPAMAKVFKQEPRTGSATASYRPVL